MQLYRLIISFFISALKVHSRPWTLGPFGDVHRTFCAAWVFSSLNFKSNLFLKNMMWTEITWLLVLCARIKFLFVLVLLLGKAGSILKRAHRVAHKRCDVSICFIYWDDKKTDCEYNSKYVIYYVILLKGTLMNRPFPPILLTIPFADWYLRLGMLNEKVGGAYRFSKCSLIIFFSLALMLQNIFY